MKSEDNSLFSGVILACPTTEYLLEDPKIPYKKSLGYNCLVMSLKFEKLSSLLLIPCLHSWPKMAVISSLCLQTHPRLKPSHLCPAITWSLFQEGPCRSKPSHTPRRVAQWRLTAVQLPREQLLSWRSSRWLCCLPLLCCLFLSFHMVIWELGQHIESHELVLVEPMSCKGKAK